MVSPTTPSAPWWAFASGRPPLVVPRAYRGNMCGVRVPGLPPIPGGADDPSLVVSWIVDRYGPSDRQRIYAHWRARDYRDVLVSWPDSRAFGAPRFLAWCAELVDAGFLPCVMLASKDYDPPDVDIIVRRAMEVLPQLIAQNLIARAGIGWELNLWLDATQIQQLIDAFTALTVPAGVKTYTHGGPGYSSFQQPGHDFASFWNPNVGKLTGHWHQKILAQTPDQYRYDSGGIFDVLLRFAGNFNVSPDSGFGHPFDFIALEITASTQFEGETTEAAGDALGRWAVSTPAATGPHGVTASVQGSGNGCAP